MCCSFYPIVWDNSSWSSMLTVFNLLVGNNFANCPQDFSPQTCLPIPTLGISPSVISEDIFIYLPVCPNSCVANSHFWQEMPPRWELRLLNTAKLQLYQVRCKILISYRSVSMSYFQTAYFLKVFIDWKIMCWKIFCSI